MNQMQTKENKSILQDFSLLEKPKKTSKTKKRVVKAEVLLSNIITDKEFKESLPTPRLPEEWEGANLESKFALLQKLEFLADVIKTATKQVEGNIFGEIDEPEIDENGAIVMTAITKDGVVVPTIYEWGQRAVASFNFEMAVKDGVNTDVLYEKKPLSKTEITKELKAQYVTPEKISSLFNVIERGKPSLQVKNIAKEGKKAVI